jgi:(p)ppGpp synthase/HD superfamily hydrolase
MLVAEATGGADPNLVVAAPLHDTIEDQGVSDFSATSSV